MSEIRRADDRTIDHYITHLEQSGVTPHNSVGLHSSERNVAGDSENSPYIYTAGLKLSFAHSEQHPHINMNDRYDKYNLAPPTYDQTPEDLEKLPKCLMCNEACDGLNTMESDGPYCEECYQNVLNSIRDEEENGDIFKNYQKTLHNHKPIDTGRNPDESPLFDFLPDERKWKLSTNSQFKRVVAIRR